MGFGFCGFVIAATASVPFGGKRNKVLSAGIANGTLQSMHYVGVAQIAVDVVEMNMVSRNSFLLGNGASDGLPRHPSVDNHQK